MTDQDFCGGYKDIHCGCEIDHTKNTRTYCWEHDSSNPASKLLNCGQVWVYENNNNNKQIRVIHGHTQHQMHALYQLLMKK